MKINIDDNAAQLLALFMILSFFALLCLCGCSTVKKVVSKSETEINRVTVNDSIHLKKDSASVTVSIDSIYDNETTIEENYQLFDTVTRLVTRKTTIKQKGQRSETSAAQAVHYDSAKVKAEVKEAIKIKEKHKDIKRSGFPVAFILWGVALLVAVCFYVYKKFL